MEAVDHWGKRKTARKAAAVDFAFDRSPAGSDRISGFKAAGSRSERGIRNHGKGGGTRKRSTV